MAFRQQKQDLAGRHQAWSDWIDVHRQELRAIGLPAEVYLDSVRWTEFLENGSLERHASSGFEFGDLAPEQLHALHRFLEREYGSEITPPLLLGWVRVRCRKAD